jgi:integrase
MALETLSNWREKREGGSDDLVFASWTGKLMSDGDLRRRVIYPTCDRLRVPRVSLHGFRHLYGNQAQHPISNPPSTSDPPGMR